MLTSAGDAPLQVIVAEFGVGSTRVGLAGAGGPVYSAPTLAAVLPAASAASSASSGGVYVRGGSAYSFDLLAPRPIAAPLRSPLGADGLLEDWDGARAHLEHALISRLGLAAQPRGAAAAGSAADSVSLSAVGSEAASARAAAGGASASLAGHAFLLCEHVYASKADREKWCEVLMEEYSCPGVFMAKSGVLGLFANGRVSGINVDMGAGGSYITPVQVRDQQKSWLCVFFEALPTAHFPDATPLPLPAPCSSATSIGRLCAAHGRACQPAGWQRSGRGVAGASVGAKH